MMDILKKYSTTFDDLKKLIHMHWQNERINKCETFSSLIRESAFIILRCIKSGSHRIDFASTHLIFMIFNTLHVSLTVTFN